MVSIHELLKAVADLTREKVNTKEPPSIISIATSGQPTMKKSIETSVKVDSIVKVMMIEHNTQTVMEREPTKEKIRQMDTFVPTTQTQGTPPQIIVIEKEKLEK